MLNGFVLRGISLARVLALLLALTLASSLLASRTALAQSSPHASSRNSTAAASRAEQEAERTVALSAEKIIELLRAEPGLLLEVKKLLVREAFAQGRLLVSADLDDEALFRLLWEDQNVRVLATREIEDRNYIRVKPTQEEMAREQERAARRRTSRVALDGRSGDPLAPETQCPKTTSDGAPNPPPPPDPNEFGPQTLPDSSPENPERGLDRTSLQNGFALDSWDSTQDRFDETEIDANSLARIVPQQSPGGLNTSSPFAATAGGQSSAVSQEWNPLEETRAGTTLPPLGTTGTGSNQYPFDRRPDEPRVDVPRRGILRVPNSNLESSFEPKQDRTMIRHRPNPYANVPSLYDLYTQVAGRPPVLARFGMEVFLNRSGNLDALPMDLPVGPDYVLGPGDGLNIQLSGSVAQRLARVVDPEGRVALPEVGAIEVSGRNLGDAQHLVQATLRTQFHDVQADVALARIRTVRIYVVGDVVSPGAYDISSLSTVLNALYAASGPTERGSLRHLRHYRGKTLVQEVDAYDLLLHGIHSELARLQPGDTLLVPPIGPEVTVQGMVQRPAIYELDGEKSLAEVLELAGGVLSSGSLRHVDVERTVAHESRTMLRLDLPEANDQLAVNLALEQFSIQGGDKIRISPILPYAEQTVYLDGHVFHPGKYPYKDGLKVTDILDSYSDLMPEPSDHAEIIRLQAPDYTPVVLAFALDETMEGKDTQLVLQPFDTIRIFSRYDFEDPPVITVNGEVRFPGDHITNGVTRLRDAVYLAGGVGPDANLEDAQVFRKSTNGKLRVLSVNLAKALAGDPVDRTSTTRNDSFAARNFWTLYSRTRNFCRHRANSPFLRRRVAAYRFALLVLRLGTPLRL